MHTYGINNGLIVLIRSLAGKLTGPADRFSGAADAFFRGFLKMAAHFHFTENTFALHLLFQRAQCLIDIIVAHNNFYHITNTPFLKRGMAYRPENPCCRVRIYSKKAKNGNYPTLSAL